MSAPLRIKTITDAHRILGLSKPEHPLISVVNYAALQMPEGMTELSAMFDFYYISLKRGFSNKLFYGQLAEPQEIANMVAFLSSDEAGYITSSTFLIDGGLVPTI
ncbi:MAG TPA: SDR family oxidoreductase [Flavipsychrobacter sp.]|nr:SDR family oxidoreductase [Flavipsychrobacter sp.]